MKSECRDGEPGPINKLKKSLAGVMQSIVLY